MSGDGGARIVYMAWQGSVHTRRWAEFFTDRGYDVHVITCGDGDAAAGARRYRVHDLGPPRLGKAGYLLKLRAARRLARRLAPDLLHAHYLTSYGLLGLASSIRPFVVTAHGNDVLVSPGNPAMRAIVRRVLSRADLITVPSEQMRQAASGLICGRSPGMMVFQYGVETQRLADVAREVRGRSAPSRQARIVSARPLVDLSRVDVLLRAVAELLHRGADVRCDIVGDGPLRTPLQRLAEGLRLGDRAAFHGYLPSPDVERIIAQADVYVSLSITDGASLALLEAMALGAVPVLSDIPANREWIHDGVGGRLVALEPTAVADGVQRALLLDRDALVAQNRRTVQERGDRETNLGRLAGELDRLLEHAGERRAGAVGVGG
jgi:L-malate glycosyltransferase